MTEYTSKSDNKHKEPEFDSTQKNNNNNKTKTIKENLIIYPELNVEVSPTIFGWMISEFMNGPNTGDIGCTTPHGVFPFHLEEVFSYIPCTPFIIPNGVL